MLFSFQKASGFASENISVKSKVDLTKLFLN